MGGKSGGTQRVQQQSEVVQRSIPKEFKPYLQKQMQLADAILQEEEEVVIPWRMTALIHLARLLLTSSMQDNVQWILGNW